MQRNFYTYYTSHDYIIFIPVPHMAICVLCNSWNIEKKNFEYNSKYGFVCA